MSFFSHDKSERPHCEGCDRWANDFGMFTWVQDDSGNWYCPQCK